jgi:CRISPR-associated protein Csd1
LNDLYSRLESEPEYEIAPPGYSLQKITFKVVLRPDGGLVNIEDVRDTTGRAPRPQQLRVLGGTKPSGSGLNPCFLWDNSGYMLGFSNDETKRDRALRTFTAFRELHLAREVEIGVPEYAAVCRFLESWEPGSGDQYPALLDAAATGYGVFQVRGQSRYVHEHPVVDAWWQAQLLEDSNRVTGQCLITGEESVLARTHDKIRGVLGGQGAGGTIVGFNDDAYESYGKSQSFNAPVSEAAAFRYVTAVNSLLDGPMKRKHRIMLADMTVAFWTDTPGPFEDLFLEVLTQGSEAVDAASTEGGGQDEAQRQRVEALLEAIRRGKPGDPAVVPDPDGTKAFILGLSPNSARISVRFFYQGTAGDLIEKVHRHQSDIGIEPQPASGRRRADPEFPSVQALLDQTARKREDIPPLLGGALLQSVLTGTPYPHALFAAAMRRVRADRSVNYLRCCVIKGFLVRNLNQEVSMALDPDRSDPAYRLGRLFATLEKTQKDALGGNLNKTIRDGFYSSASATPSAVFPRLLRTYQHHLSKLEGGQRVSREKLVQSIFDPMTGFPSQLTLADQGLFAIGYYHQTRDFYTKRADGA